MMSEDGDEADGERLVETEAAVLCPYCGEINEIRLDPGGGLHQDYVEGCQICCRPWRVRVTYFADGGADVALEAEESA